MARILIGVVLLVVVNGCSHQRWDPGQYPVNSGDTIYSIAWKYELDPFELATWNNISSPYRIYPGQRLSLKPTAGRSAAAPSDSKPGTTTKTRPEKIVVEKGDTLYGLAQQYQISAGQLASINGLKSPYMIKPGQTLKLKAPRTTSAATAPKAKPATTARTVSPHDKKDLRWQWPVQGKLITTFKSNKSGRKGIDIAGYEGKPVKAAEAGKVVYSGNGLISYGNLVIIKHNRNYLSAYAHNRKLVVKEGDMIKAGQKIAELGKTGADSPRLHFEIRKNGKPVNPLKYLPRS